MSLHHYDTEDFSFKGGAESDSVLVTGSLTRATVMAVKGTIPSWLMVMLRFLQSARGKNVIDIDGSFDSTISGLVRMF